MTSFCIILLAVSVIFINITLFLIGKRVTKLNKDLEKLWDDSVVIDLKMKQFEVGQKNRDEKVKILVQQDKRLLNYIKLVDKKVDLIEKDRENFNGGV